MIIRNPSLLLLSAPSGHNLLAVRKACPKISIMNLQIKTGLRFSPSYSWQISHLLNLDTSSRLGSAALLIALILLARQIQAASGHFEVYCDGIGFFLTDVRGTPSPGKLFLFAYTGFTGITYIPKDTWTKIRVYPGGCKADEPCNVLTTGKIRLDNDIDLDVKRVTGEYDMTLGGQHLQDGFTGKRRNVKKAIRLCE